MLFAFIALLAPSVAAQCAADWTTSTVTDLSGSSVFSIDRKSGKTTVKDLESAALTALMAQVNALQAELAQIKARTQSTFTIWGKPACPVGTTRTFSGLVVGGHSTHSGGGADMMCLPLETIGNVNKTAAIATARAIFYPAEFSTSTAGTTQQPFLRANLLYELACASCLSAKLVQMVPGRNQCFPGWTKLYSGYLMAAQIADAGRSSVLCVADNTDVIGAASNAGGPRLAPTEFRFPSTFPPPPGFTFTEDPDLADLVCVVCQI